LLNRSEEEADEILFNLSDQISRAAAGFQLSIPPARSYAHILEEANAELGKINIQYEQMYRTLMAQAAELDQKNRELSDLTRQLDEKNKILQDLAAKDGLTGLYNHRHFQEFIAQQIHQARRSGRSLSLILLDIDHFKEFNDTYGHQFGDVVLKELANLLCSGVRKADIVARYGGEEFAIILADTDLRGAFLIAEKLRVAVERCQLVREGGQDVKFTISLGVSQFSSDMKEPRDLIAATDSALYEAKKNGRNRVSACGNPL
jgi:diguanylate cyclase (GGDEF)-like protein